MEPVGHSVSVGGPIQIPFEWIAMARKYDGVIAGGALRDLVTGRMPPKDVDIFVSGLTDTNPDYMEGFSVDTLEKNGITYQIIRHRFNDDDFMDRFDLGICKIAYYPGAGCPWVATPEFLKDIGRREITVLRRDTNFEDHLARVQAKYPDFKLVDEADDDFPF